MNPDTPFVPLTGRCACERVRFRLESAPMITHCCHCRLCQQASGSAFRTFAMIETDRLTVEGEPRFVPGVVGQKQAQCPSCGSALWLHRPDLGEAVAFVGIGALDHGERLPPEVHYFIRSKHPWLALPADVPAFEALGDPGKAGFRERIMAVLAARTAQPNEALDR